MRDYSKESKWSKQKYTTMTAALDPELCEQFKAKLKANGLTFAGWLRNHMKEYLAES